MLGCRRPTDAVFVFVFASAVAASGCGTDGGVFGTGRDTASAGGAGAGGGDGGAGAGASGAGGPDGGQAGQGGSGAGAGGTGQGGFDPAQDPTAKINHPGDGETRPVDTDIPFIGAGLDPQDGQLTGASLVWTSDVEGVIGTGSSFDAQLSVPGVHVVTLTVTDSDGNVGSDAITLNMEP